MITLEEKTFEVSVEPSEHAEDADTSEISTPEVPPEADALAEGEAASGRFFAPVKETLHLSGLSWDRRRWAMNDPELRDDHRLVVSTDADVWQYPVRKEVLIGSSEQCHVLLDGDPGVAKAHVALNTDGKLFWFRCLDTNLQIKVDGKEIQEGWLRGGEELRIGDVRIYFMVPERLQAQSRLPIPFESTEIKDHSKVLQVVREGILSPSDSFDHLASVEQPEALEDQGHSTQEVEALSVEKKAVPHTKLWWAAIVVFCVGVLTILVAGGLHLRERQEARRVADLAKRADARAASAVAFREAAARTQQTGQIAKAKGLLQQQDWRAAMDVLAGVLRLPLATALRNEANALLQQAQREEAAAKALTQAQQLSLKDGKARQVLDLLRSIPATSSSASGARLLQHAVLKELRYQLQMCIVMLQAQKVTQARAMVTAWLSVVRSPGEAQSLELTQEYLTAQGMLTRLGRLDVSAAVFGTPPTDRSSAVIARLGAGANPQDKDALEWLALGTLAFRMGRLEKAINSFTRVKSLTSTRTILQKAEVALARAQRFQQGLTLGAKAAKRKQFARAIPLLEGALKANRAFGRQDPPSLLTMRAEMLALRGVHKAQQKQYAAALADLQVAQQLVPLNAALRRGWQLLEQKGNELLIEANVLKTVDQNEYKEVLRKILRLTTPSMKSHKRAKHLLIAP